MGTHCASSRRGFLKTATAATAWGLTAALAREEVAASYRDGPAEHDLLGRSVVALAELLKKREISPVDLVRVAITRIEETGKSINAFTFRTPAETIIDQAKAAEKRIANGEVNWRHQTIADRCSGCWTTIPRRHGLGDHEPLGARIRWLASAVMRGA